MPQANNNNTNSLVSKQTSGKALNFVSASFPMSKEPAGLSHADGETPRWHDTGMTWQAGKRVVWDVTVICTTADSYVEASTRESGTAAEIAATRRGQVF